MTKHSDETTRRRRAIHDQIDENLRRVYKDALTEEVPDRFRQLLAQLKAQGTAGQGDEK
jgi:hypothetical protein